MSRVIDLAVSNGVKLLDEKHPGWASEIDLDSFSIEDPSRCILGQLYGYYDTGVDELFPGMDYFGFERGGPRECGFIAPRAEYSVYSDEVWHELDATWRRVITELRYDRITD